MADIVANEKGFKVISMTLDEARSIGFGLGSGQEWRCLCDMCNRLIDDPVYYVAVLNFCLDEDCYNKWYKRATRYEEDMDWEEESFQLIKNRLANLV